MNAPTSYDAVPYESFPYPQSHPDRLATVGRLFGLEPPPIDRCRVLELGCAAGGNLIPVALALPDSRFLGIELAARQAADGQAVIAALGLSNIELRHASITDVSDADGPFDYVICHGVYSWVPRPVQDRILELCGKLLSPQGVAYVSYNTYPGWHFYGMLRDMMLFHANRFPEPTQQVAQARGLLDFLDRWVPNKEDPFGLLLKRGAEQIRDKSDSYIYHEHLEAVNEPLYFYQFMERAQGHGLQFLGEADMSVMAGDVFPPEVQQKLAQLSPNPVFREQYTDFLRNRSFRQTLLCRAGLPLQRIVGAAVMSGFHVAAGLRPVEDPGDLSSNQMVEFGRPGAAGQRMKTNDPVIKAAVLVLADAWPAALPLAEVWTAAWRRLSRAGQAQPLADAVANRNREALELGRAVYLGVMRRLVELYVHPPTFTRTAGERPLASPLARHQARTTNRVTTLRHELVQLSDIERQIVPLLDGSRDRQALLDVLSDLAVRGVLHLRENDQPITDPGRRRSAITVMLDRTLAVLGQRALLLG